VNLCRIEVAILKMANTRNFSMPAIYSGYHNLSTYEMSMKSDNVEFMRYCAGILKMATARNFSMSGINSGHHNLPTCEMSLKSDNIECVQYCGGHFENGDL
jgi:hypothetical protein